MSFPIWCSSPWSPSAAIQSGYIALLRLRIALISEVTQKTEIKSRDPRVHLLGGGAWVAKSVRCGEHLYMLPPATPLLWRSCTSTLRFSARHDVFSLESTGLVASIARGATM